MIMPEGLDPAEFVAKHGADGRSRGGHEARGRWWSTWCGARRASRPVDASRGSPRRSPTRCRSSSELTDPVRRSEYAHLVADLAGVAESSVVQVAASGAWRGRPREVAEDAASAGRRRDKVEREMLKLLVRDRRHLSTRSRAARAENISATPAHRTAVRRRSREAGGDVAALAGGEDAKLAAAVSLARGRAARTASAMPSTPERVGSAAGVRAEEPERRDPHAAPEAEPDHRTSATTSCSSNWSRSTANSAACATAIASRSERGRRQVGAGRSPPYTFRTLGVVPWLTTPEETVELYRRVNDRR